MNKKEEAIKSARQFLFTERDAILSTISKSIQGYPFCSVIKYCLDIDGAPLILISGLAEHTKNIDLDHRVSMIVLSKDKSDIQADSRLTLVGDAKRYDSSDAKKTYLTFFPEAKNYFTVHDFFIYKIFPIKARYIEGFGKIYWLEKEEILLTSS